MSFLRPGAMAALRRWRDALAGVALLALGLWWVWAATGALHGLGYAAAGIGAALVWLGLQRARFGAGGGGPGVVRVDEGRIVYFGPLTGGAVALADLSALWLDPAGRPAHWILCQPGQPDLQIPVNAEGADALLDAFASLPGLRSGRIVAHVNRLPERATRVWQRDASGQGGPRPPVAHLH